MAARSIHDTEQDAKDARPTALTFFTDRIDRHRSLPEFKEPLT